MNISLAAFMWMHRPPRPFEMDPRSRGEGMLRGLIQELHLNDKQTEQFRVLMNEHLDKIVPVKNKGRELHDALFEELANNSSTTSRDSIIQLIATNRAEGEKIIFDHLAKVRALCDEEQKKEFDHLIKGAMMRMEQPQ
ncbi:MAG: Spy/CpxP family protein refolding chaperone [Bacteroidota bacterium]